MGTPSSLYSRRQRSWHHGANGSMLRNATARQRSHERGEASMDDQPLVTIASGDLRGRVTNSIAVFRGIPCAAPPTAEGRYRSPQPVRTWAGVRDAIQAGHSSLRVLSGGSAWIYEDAGDPSGDCLFLNVWTPGLSGARPVMVW